MTIDKGGNAFPQICELIKSDDGYDAKSFSGISTRDYFAAKAMQALIGKLPLDKDASLEDVGFKGVVNGAYAYADAMIKARNV